MDGDFQFPVFGKPPVSEVVFGIQFQTLKNLKAPHLGGVWDCFRKDMFPKCEEVPLLPHVVEEFGKIVSSDNQISLEEVLPLPRYFFIDKSENELIQVQKDRLLRNWRKIRNNDDYPHFEELFPKFKDTCKLFEDFTGDNIRQNIEIDQYELTYVNQIPLDVSELKNEVISKYFKCFCDDGECYLPEPEKISWRRVYKMPQEKGRLHVNLTQGWNSETGNVVLILNLTVRGFSSDGIDEWFNLAHEWILRAFVSLTTLSAQKIDWLKR